MFAFAVAVSFVAYVASAVIAPAVCAYICCYCICFILLHLRNLLCFVSADAAGLVFCIYC